MRAGIDFDKLKDILAPALAEGQETYEFRWVGKSKAMREAGQATTKTLRPDLDESVDFDQSENVFITGDNLEALKILQESYLGAIDMIYIDPPYNTGKDFVYKDNFHKTVAEQDEAEGNLDEEGNRLYKNEKTNPRYHSDWLNMIYPRLILARNLLKDSGVIFISIDDNEQANLKQVCDEVFGEGNFVDVFINKSNPRGNQAKKLTASEHEYILVYSKSEINVNPLGFPKTLDDYGKEDSNGKFTEIGLRKRGAGSRREDAPNQYYSIYYDIESDKISTKPIGKDDIVILPKLSDGSDGRWRWAKNTVEKDVDKLSARLVNKAGGNKEYDIFEKQYFDPSKIKKIKTIFYEKEVNNENATEELSKLFNGKVFDYPKPVYTVKKLIKSINNRSSLILDFFAGSATTADAVMQLNAEDGGKRKYILCTLDEEVADKSAAQQAGYATIDQISRERIRRAADKIRKEQPDKAKDLDLGFRAFRVDESNFRDVSKAPSEFVQGNMFESVDNIREGATALDLLFQVMIAWGSRLSLKISEQKLGDNTIYSVDEGSFIACFDDRITEETIRAIAQQKPQRAVFKDTSFTHSADKINLTQIFKEVSPETQVKVV